MSEREKKWSTKYEINKFQMILSHFAVITSNAFIPCNYIKFISQNSQTFFTRLCWKLQVARWRKEGSQEWAGIPLLDYHEARIVCNEKLAFCRMST